MENTVKKTFVFEREDTQQSTIVDYLIHTSSRIRDIDSIFQKHCPLCHNLISIYDADAQNFVTMDKTDKL